MDAAAETFPSKRVYGLLIVEGDSSDEPSDHWKGQCAAQISQPMLAESLPHRTQQERELFSVGVLGVTTWQAVCHATAIDWATLPDEV